MSETSSGDLQKQIEQLKQEKEKLEAEKAALDAHKARDDAQRALDAAKSASGVTDLQNQKALADAQKALADAQKAASQAADPSNQKLAELTNQKALADAQKALADAQKAVTQATAPSAQQVTDLQNQKAVADAQKALADAATQATLARFIGDVKGAAYSGGVTLKDKAGAEEALLLGARAVKEAALKLVADVACLKDKFYLFGAKEFPNFQRLAAYRFRTSLIKQAFAAAGIKLAGAGGTADGKEEGPRKEMVTAGVVSSGLEAFSKILSFFKTDFELGGMDVKLDESLLLFTVAGGLSGKRKEVHLPLAYDPEVQRTALSKLALELSELLELRQQVESQSNSLKKAISDTEKQAADPQNAAAKDTLLKTAADLKPKVDHMTALIALYDSFVASLTAQDANGASALNAIAQEYAIDAALQGGAAVLLLRLENTGGGYLLKKHLLAGLFKIPLFHMGGATVTYAVLDGPGGKVLAGDVIPVYGGFVRTDELRAELKKDLK
jgi:hypothetical protein